ncbi:MAG: hypothetical protein KF768_13680 [Phycisphaeraceae bacterium]|nr:hypothetical protein [Phycisphaeraceae bacterium]
MKHRFKQSLFSTIAMRLATVVGLTSASLALGNFHTNSHTNSHTNFDTSAAEQPATQPAAHPPAAPQATPPAHPPAALNTRPIGRVWGVHSVTSGVGPRGLNPGWDTIGPGQLNWQTEFAVATRNLVEPYGNVPPPPTPPPEHWSGSSSPAPTQPDRAGFDEIIIYRPWGVEDHVPDKPMLFDALERTRLRAEQLSPNTPGSAALRRLADTDAFIAAARAAQDRYGKPFWYYLGQCNDPALKSADLSRLHDYVMRSVEPILIVGGNIFIDDSGSRSADSTAWLVAQSLRRLGVRGVGYEPAAHTIVPTNHASLKGGGGGTTTFTPWAYDPAMVGMITGPLWRNRIEWRDPRSLTSPQDLDRNTRAWMVPLHLTAGEVVIWGYAPDQQNTEWLIDRLAEGWSVVVGADLLQKERTTPGALRSAAAAKRAATASPSP